MNRYRLDRSSAVVVRLLENKETGLFLAQLSASAQGEITVEAIGEKGHKTTVRAFGMKD